MDWERKGMDESVTIKNGVLVGIVESAGFHKRPGEM
jgi:hypothetical protein